MSSLFKYIPSQYTNALLENGDLLFRNLTYFRRAEGRVRGDPYEGIHKDHPGTEVVLTNLTTGFQSRDAFSFLNSTDSDHIFAYCMSNLLDDRLMHDFEVDTVVEFFKPQELFRRIRFRLANLISVHKVGLLARDVAYYRPEEAALFDVKEPKNLAFVKNEAYSYQSEFRLVFGTRKAFGLIQQIAWPQHDPYEEALQKLCAERHISIGRLTDIARVVKST